jgi:hypothetical protein
MTVQQNAQLQSRARKPINLAVMLGAIALFAACASGRNASANDARLPALARTIADSVSVELLSPGVRLLRVTQLAAPWRATILDVDLNACVSVQSVKGASVAVGRATTSALLNTLDAALQPIAAVNADFFLFTPPGVPVGAHIERGVMLSGPIERPVFAMTANRRPFIGKLTVSGELRTSHGVIALRTWNRPTAKLSGVIDAHWGIPLDSTVVKTAWLLSPISASGADQQFVATPLLAARIALTAGDTLLAVNVPLLRSGDTVRVAHALAPVSPAYAVGGFPVLLRDSAIVDDVDSVSNAGFRGLNPRTAIAYADHGRHLLIAVIDGRQPRYSMGMSLRQTADLFRALGATDAVNLDGGGSSAMVVRALASNTFAAGARTRLVNHPSDSVGERPVANALALLRSCR